MSMKYPFSCVYHDWEGRGRCPYCMDKRIAEKQRKEKIDQEFESMQREFGRRS